ncbi:TonB-dependent receptor [Agarivorans sp. QJM3NY_25]|uniref:TonB-dependent receptor n=1 Tax=Agarivorans sp. QJM3NY_25 TaxID=3421430 RepID=UPI003D7EC918
MMSHCQRNIRASLFYSRCLLACVVSSMAYSSILSAEPVSLETYVVTGEKRDKNIKDVPTGVTLISGERLESGEYKEAKETAVLAPNVIADSFNNISIRGISGGGAATGGLAYLTGARARVVSVVDGVTQDFSGYNFNPVSVWDIEQLEVLRGPQSSSQGSSAIGGALVINTNDPTFYREAAFRGGFENYKNGNMNYNLGLMSSGPLLEDELAYRVVIDATTGEGWLNYDTNGYDTPNLSESDNLNARGKLLWLPTHIPALSAKLTLNYHNNQGEHANFASNTDEGIASKTFSLNGSNEVRLQDSKADSIATDIDYQINDSLTNSLHISRSSADIHDDAYSTGNTYDINNETYALENRLLLSENESALTGVVGIFISHKDASLATSNFTIATEYQTTTSALYGEGTYSLSPKYRLVAGVRVENEDADKTSSTAFSGGDNSQNDSETYYLPKLSLLYDLADSTTLAATASKGYSPSGLGINFFGEEYSYDSETVSAFELSSKSIFVGGSVLNANLFYNDYKNYQAGTSGFTIENVGKSYTYGLELEGSTWLTNNLEITTAIGLLDSEISDDESYQGNQLTNAPKLNASLGFTVYIDERWTLGANATYVGEYYSDLENTETSVAGDYALLDVRASYRVGDFTINAYIKNLTNDDAVSYRAGALASVGQSRTIGMSAMYRM